MKRTFFALVAILCACVSFAEEQATVANEKAEAIVKEKKSVWLEEYFGKELVDAQKKKHSVDELNGKMIGIYFSAHWCPPCRQFTPKLVEFRDALKDKDFEIVFVSCDRDKKSMEQYMTETKMKWLAVPFGNEKINYLAEKYDVSGIPRLVIIGKDGKVIESNARPDVQRKGVEAFKKWKK